MPAIRKVVWVFDGISNSEELHRRLGYCMLRRTKLDVNLELPAKTRLVVDVDVPTRAQIRLSETLFQNKAAMRRALDVSADGKLKPTIEMILGDLEGGHKVIAFTHRKLVAEHVIDAAAQKGYSCGFIHSGVSLPKREKLIAEARAAPGEFLIAATIDSTSTGIDLSFADVAIVVELPYEWHVLAQAESRLHRFGQKRPVLIRYPVARGSSEELILSALLSKIDAFEKIIGPTDDGLRTDLDAGPKGQDALDELYETIVKAQAEAAPKASRKARDRAV